ncbi:DUF4241 domain-containing protein [Kitasatospora sp. NPDC048365]|uniref:DUF4241 domain-containing protein n=1 Tax=Kitasatospora sp. NPDC048365 TaxID=3364050 RepID=UPI003723E4E5
MAAAPDGTPEVRHCEGWDPERRAPYGALTEREARERDATGLPYAAVLSRGGQAAALFQVDWSEGYLGVFLFDHRARRHRIYEYRQLEPGRLHLRRFREWLYETDTEPEEPEDFEDGRFFELTADLEGRSALQLTGDGSFHTSGSVPPEHLVAAKAPFGRWTAYVDGPMLGLAAGAPAPVVVEEAGMPADGPGWAAPRALRPNWLEALFTPGSRFAVPDEPAVTVVEPEPMGTLRLPTGALVVGDPGFLDEKAEPYTVTAPPGAYPLSLGLVQRDGERWSSGAAALLRISDRPAASWELALLPGQDARLLGEDEFHGAGVDTATLAFADAAARPALEELGAAALEHPWSFLIDEPRTYPDLADPVSGANLIACLTSGDGNYPVWIGRDADGAVTCFVADLLQLRGAEPLPPTEQSAAVVRSPFHGTADGRREEPTAAPSARADFLARELAELTALRDRVSRR